MKKALQKLFSLFKKADPARKGKARKTRAQSLVEFAIALPFMIALFAGVMEFGFVLNTYLSLLDATREAARFYSQKDPFEVDALGVNHFYSDTAARALGILDPKSIPGNEYYEGRRIILDPAADDVVVTVFCVQGGAATSYFVGGDPRFYKNVTGYLEASYIEGTYLSTAPDTGLMLVEVFYNYHPVVVSAFYNRPMMLRAHTIMPTNAADPSPTTGCP